MISETAFSKELYEDICKMKYKSTEFLGQIIMRVGGLAQSVERATPGEEVLGLIPAGCPLPTG